MVNTLERASRSHSREMVSRAYFSHSSFNGESFGARLIRFGYTTSGCTRWTVGEDIACGYGPGATVKAIFRAWWHSPAHRRVILTKSFRSNNPTNLAKAAIGALQQLRSQGEVERLRGVSLS